MKKEYDFTNAKKNPYVNCLKKQITINIDVETIEYFKQMAKDTNIPYQSLINMYLKECAKNNKRINISFN